MNKDSIGGKWSQLKGEAKAQWGKLTDDDLTRVAGHRDKLLGLLQERYGHAKDEADRQIKDFNAKHHLW